MRSFVEVCWCVIVLLVKSHENKNLRFRELITTAITRRDSIVLTRYTDPMRTEHHQRLCTRYAAMSDFGCTRTRQRTDAFACTAKNWCFGCTRTRNWCDLWGVQHSLTNQWLETYWDGFCHQLQYIWFGCFIARLVESSYDTSEAEAVKVGHKAIPIVYTVCIYIYIYMYCIK